MKKQRELGITFYNFDSFGLMYKSGNQKSKWRYHTMLMNGGANVNKTKYLISTQNSMGLKIAVGKEYIKPVNEHFELMIGGDLSFTYARSAGEKDDLSLAEEKPYYIDQSFQPGMNLVLGFNYVFISNLLIGAEFRPYFTYFVGKKIDYNYTYDVTTDVEDVTNYSGFSYTARTSTAVITMAYRF